jgi:YD repeat-containing protein
VTRKMFAALFILVVLQGTLSIPLAGQSCTGKLSIERINFLAMPGTGAPGCFWLAASDIPGDYVVGCWYGSCPPPSWCATCGKNIATAAHPINLTNGNTYIQQKDVKMPGLGGGLNLERTWSSMWPSSQSGLQVGLFGPNWRSTYEEAVTLGSGIYTNYEVYTRSDGSFWVFGPANGSTFPLASPANGNATLAVTNNGTQWTITFQNGEQRVFSYTSGLLTSIIDRNGNTTQLTYDTGGTRLITVTDAASRHLNFTYGSSYSNRLITGVSSDVGLTLSYAYDSQGRLTQVTEPDLTTISFTYNSQSQITAVTDSNGKTLESHTYDSLGRGLTSSRANGVEAVTISYPQ